MWATILSWIGAPIASKLFGSAVEAYKAKLAAGNTSEKLAGDLAAKELEVQQLEIQAQSQLKIAEVGHPWEPEKLFGYIMVIYFGKIILFDKVIGSFFGGDVFSTDSIKGDALSWAGMIMAFYLGKRGIENVARILKRK